MPVADYAGAFFLLVTRHALRSIDGSLLTILAWRSASKINYNNNNNNSNNNNKIFI